MGNTRFQHTTLFHRLICIDNQSLTCRDLHRNFLSLGKLYLSREVLSQRLCVCLLILNARRVTLHVLLSIVVRPRTITKLPPTRSCFNQRILRHESCERTTPGIYSRKFTKVAVRTCGLISVLLIVEEHVLDQRTFSSTIEKPFEILPADLNDSNPVVHYHVEIFNAVGTRTLAHLITLVLPLYLAYISYGKYPISTHYPISQAYMY